MKKYFIIPRNLVFGAEAQYLLSNGDALPLAGKDMAFLNFEIQCSDTLLDSTPLLYSIKEQGSWNTNFIPKDDIKKLLKTYSHKPNKFLGLKNKKFYIMGILNVTSDSFSKTSNNMLNKAEAIKKALKMYEDGASIIDIGGESTRPGAIKITTEEEKKRVIPIIKALYKYNIPISCDTRNSSTMQAAIDEGATIINDISALSDDKAADIISKNNVGLIIMHMQGQPENMQKKPLYKNVSFEIVKYLESKKKYAIKKGIKEKNIIIDPGIGFGKNDKHNLKIFKDLALLHSLKSHVLIGASRKSIIGRITNTKPSERLSGSISLAIASLTKGVKFFRVHDVKETKQALTIWEKI
ncbi:dihydropteroate synthase [Alphaproteobacteria bacterium]|nr:dihydropteroate synthase [Alphaproteobacteria bacterium]